MAEHIIKSTEHLGPDKEARIAKIYDLLFSWTFTDTQPKPTEKVKSAAINYKLD